MIRRFFAASLALICVAILSACVSTPIPLAVPSLAVAPTEEPTLTPIVLVATPASTETPTPTAVSTGTATPSPSPTATQTPQATLTRTANGILVLRVPILMYHYISVPPADADKYRLDLSVTPEEFQSQLDYLTEAGYHPVRLSDLTATLLTGIPLPEKPIVLSFDDGYTDNYVNAFPILKAHNFTGTFFVIVDALDENRWGYMNWAQVEEMAASGMEIGSHSLDHIELEGKTRIRQSQQILESKLAIDAHLPSKVTSFSYPSGKYDVNTMAVLKSAGYLGAVTEVQGALQSSDDPFELRRIRIRGSYTVADFAHWIKYYTENASSK